MTNVIQYWDGSDWQHENPVQKYGKIEAPASVADAASINIPVGVAPSSPIIGDIWQTTDGLYYRNNAGATVGPLGAPPALDADLVAIAALAGTSGLLRKTAADTWTLDTTTFATDSGVVHLAGVETITGNKTFTGTLGVSGASGYVYLQPKIDSSNYSLLDMGTSSARLSVMGTGNEAYFLASTSGLELSTGGVDDIVMSPGGSVYVYSDVNISGLLLLDSSDTGQASLRIPHGIAPTAPTNGDMWTTTSGIFTHINGSTRTTATLESSQTFTGSKTFNAFTTVNNSLDVYGSLYAAPGNGGVVSIDARTSGGDPQTHFEVSASSLYTYSQNTGTYTSFSMDWTNIDLYASTGTTLFRSKAGVFIRQVTGQTAKLLELQNSSTNPVASIDTSGNLIVNNLTVNGTTTTVNSTTVTVDDPIFTLGGDTAPTIDDNKDRGIEFRWHNGSAAKIGFFGYDDSTGAFTFIPDATNTSEVFSGTKGTIDAYFSGSNINAGTVGFSYLPTGTTGSTVAIGNHTHSYQPLDADLTSIAGLAGTSGLLRKTATDTWSLDTNTYLTANQTITLSGDASGSGTTAITVTVSDDSHAHTGTTISGLDAGDVTTGVFAIGLIPTGTTGTTVSLGNHTHSYLSSSTSSTQDGYFGNIALYDDSTPSHYLTITNSANLTLARTLSINVNDADRTVSLSGNLTVSSAATVSGTNTGDQTISLTGDVTGSGTGSFATTLATVNTNTGSWGSASSVATFTVNGKGLVTAASNTAIQIAQSQVTNLTTDLGLKAPLASPTFTGTPAAPTAAVDTNTTQLATTAFVIGQGYLKSATAASTYAPLASPTFTGTVTAATLDLTTAATATAATSYWVETGSDGILRPKTLANVKTEIVTAAAVNAASPDHGSLSGLGDDDHAQYVLANGTRPFTSAVSYAPQVQVINTNNDATGAYLILRKAAADTLHGSGETMGSVMWQGARTGGTIVNSAWIDGTSIAAQNATGLPSKLTFSTTKLDGNPAQAMEASVSYGHAVGENVAPSPSGTMFTALGGRRTVWGDSDTGIGQVSDGVLAVYANDVERLYIDSTGTVAWKSLSVKESGSSARPAFTLASNNAAGYYMGILSFDRTNEAGGQTPDSSVLGELRWVGRNTANSYVSAAMMKADMSGAATANGIAANLSFHTSDGSSGGPSERMRIDSSGSVLADDIRSIALIMDAF